MKTTLEIPDELMRGMKIRAATQGRKLKDVVADAIRESLFSKHETPNEAPQMVISRSAVGLPFIRCKPALGKPAPTFDELQQLIGKTQLEEDLQRARNSH